MVEEENRYSYEKFKERWPNMFERVTCGFYLPPGWGGIVWDLCAFLEKMGCEQTFTDEDGKVGGVFRVDQVKEKFGGLRFYYGFNGDIVFENLDEKVRDWNDLDKIYKSIEERISFTEQMSYYVCDMCGTTHDVATDGKGWITTLCKNCRVIREEKRKKQWG